MCWKIGGAARVIGDKGGGAETSGDSETNAGSERCVDASGKTVGAVSGGVRTDHAAGSDGDGGTRENQLW
jgi:hypothetical protein